MPTWAHRRADHIPNTPLPTLEKLEASLPENVDAKAVAQSWFNGFTTLLATNGTISEEDIDKLFVPDSFWRDLLSMTWDFRTFSGSHAITTFLADRLSVARPSRFQLREDDSLALQQFYPDVAWISFVFNFESEAGLSSGIARLVPTDGGAWKAHCVFTNLEELKGYPERIGQLRNDSTISDGWEAARSRELSFEDEDPTVLVIGAGHCGLEIAARLKALQVKTLVVDKIERIGDNWRARYDTMCLHDYLWFDTMPYLPFPSTWPVYIPARKLANWLEFYADALDLNVWTSTDVVKATQDEDTGKWNVRLKQADGPERSLIVKHVVFATGLGDSSGEVPKYPGMEAFQGQILHSTRYQTAEEFKGKKVLVIGACNSAHDIARDLYEHGIDVTMHQRSSTHVMSVAKGWPALAEGLYSETSPPPDVSDRIANSFPAFMSVEMNRRSTKMVEELDKDLLEGLRQVGFKLNSGIHGTGFALLFYTRGGGFYLDVGASKLVASGKIKLKAGGEIQEFSKDGVKFGDGVEVLADAVVFATGLGDPMTPVVQILGKEVASRCKPLWGLDEEGELNGVWRDWGVKNLWAMMGNLGMARFWSKRLALQIKAIEEGVFGERYSISKE